MTSKNVRGNFGPGATTLPQEFGNNPTPTRNDTAAPEPSCLLGGLLCRSEIWTRAK